MLILDCRLTRLGGTVKISLLNIVPGQRQADHVTPQFSVACLAAPQEFELAELPVPKYCNRVVVPLLVEKFSARIPIVFVVFLLQAFQPKVFHILW